MEFVDDLPARSRKSRAAYVAAAAELREHPGQWAILRTLPKVTHALQLRLACGIRTGRLAAFRPAGSYEATVLTRSFTVLGPREWAVYVRYVGTRAP